MKDSELVKRIEKSLKEGFTPQEVVKALRDDGYSDQRISNAVQKAQAELQSSGNRD